MTDDATRAANNAIRKAREIYPPHVANAVAWSLGCDGVMFDDAQAALIAEVLADSGQLGEIERLRRELAEANRRLAASTPVPKPDGPW